METLKEILKESEGTCIITFTLMGIFVYGLITIAIDWLRDRKERETRGRVY